MWTIDKICGLTHNPNILNALHACRIGHPWNKTAVRPWTTAAFMAAQTPGYVIPSSAVDWLKEQAEVAGE